MSGNFLLNERLEHYIYENGVNETEIEKELREYNNKEHSQSAPIPQKTAGLWCLAFILSKNINTSIAINIASNPSLRIMKNELAKGVINSVI